ncbi:PREDICTED: neuropeptide-like protein C4orf48 homolog [Ceratotherium simum simum]|uniref:NELL2-interacting cell ontogeny regulator 1 n=1 Tax=Ceratotherium simum simum TaxID=73337 RepID=A0ABM0HRF0_CERSS|nr:PREDICTED: neuropeptide-like protein C4orf48 homolog [Ceratotherium simum simum]
MRGARRAQRVFPSCPPRFRGVPEPRAAPGSLGSAMAPPPPCRSPRSPPRLLLLLLSFALLGAQARAEPAAGSAVPAQSRPCVDCHAFEFMQRALQDLRKTAYSLDARTESLLLQAERRALCACWPSGR